MENKENVIMEQPKEIQELTDKIEEVHNRQKFHESQAKLMGNEWLRLRILRQRKCNHRYADGTSSWRHNYAYSNCVICGYDDL
jgi:hypothetical protein